MLIDEKCRILNKTGTPKSSALHLAKWMKGQLDKQQEEALRDTDRRRLSEDNVPQQQQQQPSESDHEERITYWTRQQLEKRTKELNLEKECGLHSKPHNAGKRLSGVDELSMSDAYSEAVSQKSHSHSTTSDSQITVRSSPIVLDKLAVCRHCHKNCQQQGSVITPKTPTSCHSQAQQPSSVASVIQPPLCRRNSPKLHEASSSCCKVNGRAVSDSSLSSSTITVDKPSDRSSKLVGSSSDVAQLLTDDISQSEATCDNIGPIPSTSSTGREDNIFTRQFTDQFEDIRVLNQTNTTTAATTITNNHNHKETLVNGHCSSALLENPLIDEKTCEQINTKPKHNNQTTTKTHKSSLTKVTLGRHAAKFIPCNCDCTPADFANTTLSPDELEQQTCKIIESPKQCLQIQELETKTNDQTPSGIAIKFSSIKHFVPTIAVLPATPEAMLTKTSTNIWDNKSKYDACSLVPEDSCDESPLDEELPYRPMSHTLRRYGTMSSLEKLPSEECMAQDLEDQLNNADDEDDDEHDDNARADTVTYENMHNEAMAGSKMTFFEESRAFIDRYLNRWQQDSQSIHVNSETEVDECTSGATSGEEVWGTPTSGGDNDDMHLINSENTYSSPTKSSNSLNDDDDDDDDEDDDDDTELMMDELLMAPPMTASTIRGLLPR